MINDFVKKSIKAYLNYRSFKTNRQLILIESDDWGSIRTQNIKTLNKLNDISRAVKQDPYIQLDSIASSNDLSALFEILNSVRDSKGNPACITANVCTANPDFNAIKASNFNEFHYEIFTQTLDRYSNTENLFDLWKNAEKEKLFYPQLHGREHVHAPAWLAELRAGNKDLLKAFELNSFGIPYNGILSQKRKKFSSSFRFVQYKI